MEKIKILAISGSIRPNSSSHVIIDEIQKLIPTSIEFNVFDGLASIPAFDGRDEGPQSVIDFKIMIKEADGILICTPEYAFGVPGALKNALDWTVGTGEFVNKPVALITASSQGEKGHESLLNTLTAISTILDSKTNLLISFIRAKVKDGKIVDADTKRLVEQLVKNFIERL